jgi:hypothetical protein
LESNEPGEVQAQFYEQVALCPAIPLVSDGGLRSPAPFTGQECRPSTESSIVALPATHLEREAAFLGLEGMKAATSSYPRSNDLAVQGACHDADASMRLRTLHHPHQQS